MRKKSEHPLYNSMNKYGIENFEFIVLLRNADEHLLYYLEETLIENLNLQDRNFGYNLSNGGKVNKGYKVSEDVVNRQSERMTGKNNSFYGKNHSEETKETISKKAKNRKVAESTKKKISEKHKREKSYLYNKKGKDHIAYGRVRPKEEIDSIKKNMPHSIKVGIINDDKDIIMEFLSLQEASNWIIKNHDIKNKNPRSIASNIKRSIKNEYKCYGYRWIFIEKS